MGGGPETYLHVGAAIITFVNHELKVWLLDLRGCTYCELILKYGICTESAPMFTGRMHLLAGHHLQWFSAPVVIFYFHTWTLFWDWLAYIMIFNVNLVLCVSIDELHTKERVY